MAVDIEVRDLTGEEESYKKIDVRFMVFESAQLIEFREPVFAKSIHMYKVSKDGGEPISLEKDKDWFIRNSFRDIKAISVAKLDDPAFVDNLVVSVIMSNADVSEQYQITVDYQSFYRDYTNIAGDTAGPAYTPALMRTVIDRLDYLTNVKNPVTDITSDPVGGITVMPEDYTGDSKFNHVKDEVHKVDTINNKFIIRPINGSFYNHDIKLTYGNKSLVESVDYVIRGMNPGKTRVSAPTSGVYEYIVITSEVVGDVILSYHAFGGLVSAEDVNRLKDGILAIRNVLINGLFITKDNFSEQPAYVELEQRVAFCEEVVKHYQSQVFSYTTRFIEYDYTQYAAANWVNVAYAAHGPWSADVDVPVTYKSDMRVELDDGFFADVLLEYNLATKSFNCITKAIKTANYDEDGVKYFEKRDIPQFRILFDKTKYNRGLILQMNINSSSVKTHTVKLFDKTGTSTIWKLIDSLGKARPMCNDRAYFPDGKAEWRYQDPNMAATDVVSVISDYTIFAGNIPMFIVDSETYREGVVFQNIKDGTSILDETLQVEKSGFKTFATTINNFDILPSKIKGIRVVVFDRITGTTLTEVSQQTQFSIEYNEQSIVCMYYINDLCSIECVIKRIDTTVGTTDIVADNLVTLRSRSGTHSLNNERFDLRRLDIIM